MIFFITLLTVDVEKSIRKTGPLNYTFILKAGRYNVSCYGAQGGTSYNNAKTGANGGKGAFVTGIMSVTGTGTQFWAFVGGKGKSSQKGPNAGGYNGGGIGGEDLGSFNEKSFDAPGGGGGATDLRIGGSSLADRIIVAAGGSGAACLCEGAPGGDLYGYYAPAINYTAPDDKVNQKGGHVSGNGGNGEHSTDGPGSGGGGGWRGGPSSGKTVSSEKESHLGVARSGSSYISGYGGCTVHEKMQFTSGMMFVGVRSGHGYISINPIFLCEDNCAACTNRSTCTECFDGFFLNNSKCIDKCPSGTAGVSKVCQQCDPLCKTCEESTSKCTSCIDGYYLSNNKCVEKCPTQYYASDGECKQCKEPCYKCINTAETCLTCITPYFLQGNECVKTCKDGTVGTEKACLKCSPYCATCYPTPNDCTSCKEGYYLYNNRCYSSCPDNTVEKGEQCVDCKSPCATCISDIDHCTTCIENFYLSGNQCVASCPEGTTQTKVACV